MSISRNMQTMMLQVRTKTRSPSGQWVEAWVDVKNIEVGIYPASYTILTSSNIKYSESTNTGLTLCKDIKEVVNRIVKGTEIYDITFANNAGRYAQLFLKRVVYNG